MYATVVVKFN